LNQSNKLVVALIAICAAIWIIAAINPLDRQAWVLENILLVVFVGGLALTHRRLQLSNASWILLAAFVILHTIGTHYTYEKMPLGIWAKDFFHLSRNHYDRFAHGAFGFLLAFPIRELLLRFSGIRRGVWSFASPVAIILAVSGCFEIIESIVAEIVAPGKGVQWLGGQGDEWPRTIWSRRSSVRCLWWVSLRCCNGRRLALASILFPSLPLGETHARAAVRAQEWVGERRTQSETHSLIRTHAISRSIFCPLRLSVMLRSGLHWRSIRSIAAIGCSKISSPLYC
jgi:putative membrane protein